jgi:hypothetical protein
MDADAVGRLSPSGAGRSSVGSGETGFHAWVRRGHFRRHGVVDIFIYVYVSALYIYLSLTMDKKNMPARGRRAGFSLASSPARGTASVLMARMTVC